MHLCSLSLLLAVQADFFVSKDKEGFTINFGKITGNFDCSGLDLKSLKGAPQEVGGWFDCSENQLASLEGAPREVGRSFYCYKNQLASLEGAPKTVGESFYCYNNQLISLKGAPQIVGGIVGGNFDCRENPDLHSLDGIGKVKGETYKDF